MQNNVADSSNASLSNSVVTFTQDGKVGIGITNPGSPLQIVDSSDASLRIFDNSGVSGDLSSSGWKFRALAGNAATNANGLQISHGTTERIHITTAGNIGIGTDAPENDIHLKTESATMKLTSTDAATSARLILESESDSYGGIHFGDPSDEDVGRIRYYHGGSNPDHMQFSTGATERLRILSTGGITFNGDTAAANALDDYEEGSWTPTVLSEGNIGTPQYTCTYTKIGRLVTINADIAHLTDTTSNTNIKIGGLPYVPSGTVAREYSAVCHGERYSGGDIIVAYLVYNSGSFGISFRFGVPTNHFSYVRHSHISDNGEDNNLRFTLTYEIT